MSDESASEVGLASSRISRRNLMKAGAIVGGAVWVAPVIDSFTSVAAAGSPTATKGLSYVTVLLCETSGTTCYRMKFGLSCLTGNFSSVTTSTCSNGGCGPSPTDGYCYQNKYSGDPTLKAPSGYSILGTEPTPAASSLCASGITGAYTATLTTGGSSFHALQRERHALHAGGLAEPSRHLLRRDRVHGGDLWASRRSVVLRYRHVAVLPASEPMRLEGPLSFLIDFYPAEPH